MEKVTYDKEITALLVIDPYNDFISEGGKIWDRIKGSKSIESQGSVRDHP
jgi:ureidoacrylate peracid hydrolase